MPATAAACRAALAPAPPPHAPPHRHPPCPPLFGRDRFKEFEREMARLRDLEAERRRICKLELEVWGGRGEGRGVR